MEKQKQGMVHDLVSELSLMQQLVMQLESHLRGPCDVQFSKSLASQLLSATNKSIGLASSLIIEGEQTPTQTQTQTQRERSKKRKTLPRWRSQVSTQLGPLDAGDGHSWRKYGQKDILGAKHPRGYYRCTYRNSQGCLATKQVQRTDHDPALFDVIYQGTHTCTNTRSGLSAPASSNSNSNSNSNNYNNITVNAGPSPSAGHGQDKDQCYLNSLKATLTVQTQGLSARECFSFPSTQSSESNRISSFPCGLRRGFGTVPASRGGLGFPKADAETDADADADADAELTEVLSALSAAASTPSSPMGGMDMVFDGFNLDTSFQIDTNFVPSSLEFQVESLEYNWN